MGRCISILDSSGLQVCQSVSKPRPLYELWAPLCPTCCRPQYILAHVLPLLFFSEPRCPRRSCCSYKGCQLLTSVSLQFRKCKAAIQSFWGSEIRHTSVGFDKQTGSTCVGRALRSGVQKNLPWFLKYHVVSLQFSLSLLFAACSPGPRGPGWWRHRLWACGWEERLRGCQETG